MKMNIVVPCLAGAILCTAARGASEAPASLAALREDGAFQFPQRAAKALCDNAVLRFSVWNNEEFLFAQAVLWQDDDPSLGKSEDNREIGDWSQVMLDLDADQKPTANVDRNYPTLSWSMEPGRLSGMVTPRDPNWRKPLQTPCARRNRHGVSEFRT